MNNKRLLILVNHEIVIYNFRLELVERLLEEGFEVYISSPYGKKIDDLIALGCNYIKTDMNRHGLNVYQEWKMIQTYKKMIQEVKPSVILTYTIKPNIYGALAARSFGVPVLANITGLGTAVENGGLMQKISVALYKYAFRNISKVYFQNTENRQFFIDHKIAAGKHELLPGSGVNLERFPLLEYPDDSTIDFVFVSRIMKEKGINHYIEAARYIRNKHPNTRFHVLGFCEEDYEKGLNKLHEQGIIVYHGMQRDITAYLKESHCTIHPTYYPEGMSNVLLESAASGRPVIATNRSGCREIVDDGVNGYLVEQKDSQDLIEKIELFLGLPYEEKKNMGLAGRKKVEEEFDREIVVDVYMQGILKVINLI